MIGSKHTIIEFDNKTITIEVVKHNTCDDGRNITDRTVLYIDEFSLDVRYLNYDSEKNAIIIDFRPEVINKIYVIGEKIVSEAITQGVATQESLWEFQTQVIEREMENLGVSSFKEIIGCNITYKMNLVGGFVMFVDKDTPGSITDRISNYIETFELHI